MGVALRALGFVVFIAAVGGATFGAYQLFPPDASFSAVELTPVSEGPVQVLAGSPTPIQIQAQNMGEDPVSFRILAADSQITFQTTPSVIQLDGNASTRVTGVLAVPESLAGPQEITLNAVANGTEKRIGQTTLAIRVAQAQLPEVTVNAGVPGVIPGSSVEYQVSVTNPAPAQQSFNLSLQGAQGTVTPETLRVRANGSQAATVNVSVPDTGDETFEPTIVVTTQNGRTVTAPTSFRVVQAGTFLVDPVFSDYTVAPGNLYTVPVVIVSNVEGTHPVEITGEDMVNTTFTDVADGSTVGGFITLRAPDGLSSTTSPGLEIALGEATQGLGIQISPPTGGQQATGDHTAELNYIGRLEDGRVFDTSVPEVMVGPFPKTDTFRPRPNPQPLEFPLSAQAGAVIEGFRTAVIDMTPGETKTAILPPSQAYGGERVHENVSATTELNRQDEVPRYLRDFPVQQLPPSFGIENATEGDRINYTTTSNGVELTFKFRLVEKTEQTVTLERMERPGDTTTFYAPWPEATEVVDVTNESIVFETTPPEDLGAFTWDVQAGSHQAGWANATTVESVNETAIVLRHSPEEGLTYQASGNPRAPPQTYRVEAVTDETIHVSTSNPNPLGGHTLTFDIYLLGLTETPEQQPNRPGGVR